MFRTVASMKQDEALASSSITLAITISLYNTNKASEAMAKHS